ncbi:hypothetical protein D1007_07644 [Hordeum vulgare]|nr:hypothetical protein D1007_07644 [Hordeum vulgare]
MFWQNKWEKKKEKREEVATKMTKRFEGILAKKKEIYVKRSDVNEEKKAEKFYMLMTVVEKKINLEARKINSKRE